MNDRKLLTNFFDGAKLNSKHVKMICIIAMAMVFEQADNYNFSFVAPTLVKYWGLTVQTIGNINSLYAVGMLIGTFIAGICSDRLGRKKTILGASFIFSVGTLLNGISPNVYVFMAMRVLTGIGVSAVLIVSPTYFIEMLPTEGRGRIVGFANLIGFLGIPAIAFMCNLLIPMSKESWRLIYVIGAVGLVLIVLGSRWLEESPRWLVSKGRVREAEQVTEKIVGPGYKSDLSQVVIHDKKVPVKVVLKEMFSKKLIKSTLALMAVFCLTYPVGLIFVNFLSTILVDRGFTIAQGLKLTSLLSLGMLGGPLVATVIADWGGRKIPLVICEFVIAACCVGYGLAGNFTMLCVFALGSAGLAQTAAILANTYAGELYPTRIRNAATGMVMSMGRVCTIIMMACFPVIYKIFGFVGVYIFIGVVYSFVGIAIAFLGKRTSGVSLEALTEETEEAA